MLIPVVNGEIHITPKALALQNALAIARKHLADTPDLSDALIAEFSSLYTSSWDTVILAGMPESSHRDVKLLIGNSASIKRLHRRQVTIHGMVPASQYDDSGTCLRITMSAMPFDKFRTGLGGLIPAYALQALGNSQKINNHILQS